MYDCMPLCPAQKGNIKVVYAPFRTCHLKWWMKPNQQSMAGETVRATLETIVHVGSW